MIELPLGIVAWLSCILLQAILHYTVMPRRRKSQVELSALSIDECDKLDAILEEIEYDDAERIHIANDELEEDRRGDITPLPLSPCLPFFGACDRPMEDEPRQIRQLLNQTGSELLNASWSSADCESMTFFELLAKEQLENQDCVTGGGSDDEADVVNSQESHCR